MRVRPFKGRYCSREQANRVNDMLLSSTRPDHTALKKESEEFIEYIKAKRNEEYLALLDKSMAEAEDGRSVVKTIAELEAME